MEELKAYSYEMNHGREEAMLSHDQRSEIHRMAKSGKAIKQIVRDWKSVKIRFDGYCTPRNESPIFEYTRKVSLK